MTMGKAKKNKQNQGGGGKGGQEKAEEYQNSEAGAAAGLASRTKAYAPNPPTKPWRSMGEGDQWTQEVKVFSYSFKRLFVSGKRPIEV